MDSFIEKLPWYITVEGQNYFLRIKKRAADRKWNLRYLGKVPPKEKKLRYSFKTKVRGFSYKTSEYDEYGRTLEGLAKRVYLRLEKDGLL